MKKHLSTKFESHLKDLRKDLSEMGGLLESQLDHALMALDHLDKTITENVIQNEKKVDELEKSIDGKSMAILTKYQPIANDLRFVFVVGRVASNLERIGDEIEKVSRNTQRIIESNTKITQQLNYSEIKVSGELLVKGLHNILNAFATLDTNIAHQIIAEDKVIDNEFRAFVRKATSYMAEEPKTVSLILDLLFIAKAFERIGDHITNIAELIIYAVDAKDIRHENSK